MMTMRAFSRLAFGVLVSLATTLALAAPAVRDLAGGPAVNQIDLHPPVSQIAVDQQWLHNFMLIVCTVIFLAFGDVHSSSRTKVQGRARRNFHESTTVELAGRVPS